MKELIEYIRYDFIKNQLDDDYHFYNNSIYIDFNISPERLFLRDEIIDIINTHYLPFYQNFERLDD
jgi:hypothetical protein